MIARHLHKAVKHAIGLGIATAVLAGCIGLAVSQKDPSIVVGIATATLSVSSAIASVILYFAFVLALGNARGYGQGIVTAMIFGTVPFVAGAAMLMFPVNGIPASVAAGLVLVLLGPAMPVILLLVLPDKSNPVKDAEVLSYTGARCVSCNGRMASHLKLCPHCGWTQPACDILPPRPVAG